MNFDSRLASYDWRFKTPKNKILKAEFTKASDEEEKHYLRI